MALMDARMPGSADDLLKYIGGGLSPDQIQSLMRWAQSPQPSAFPQRTSARSQFNLQPPPPSLDEQAERIRKYNQMRDADPDSQFNDYLARRSFEGPSDPFMVYYNNLDHRNNWQRETQPLDPDTKDRLDRYMRVRREMFERYP